MYSVSSSFNDFINSSRTVPLNCAQHPYTILLENIKTDLNLVIKNIKSSLNKMQRKTAIILDEPIKRKLFNIFTQTRITLKEQDLSLIKSLFNENQRKKLNKYIKLNKSINKTKNVIVHIDI